MKEKATIVLHPKVAKQIRWLTHNYDKEVGAIGIGGYKTVNGKPSVYVEELLFPEQEVTGSTVDISASAWVKLRTEHGADKLNKMMFYWHRHPGGSPHHSSVDEDDTFGSFMNDSAGRKYFAFLQTAVSGKELVHEARIDLRDPFRVTIENPNIDLVVEQTDEDREIQEFLSGILKERVKPKTYAPVKYDAYDYYKYKGNTAETGISKLFSDDKTEQKVTILFEGQSGNECCSILADELLARDLDYELGDLIAGTVKDYVCVDNSKMKGFYNYKLIPAKGKYNDMKKEIRRIHKYYLQHPQREEDEDDAGLSFSADNIEKSGDALRILNNKPLVTELIDGIYNIGYLNTLSKGDGYSLSELIGFEENDVLGTVYEYDPGDVLTVKGEKLIALVEDMLTLLSSGYSVNSIVENGSITSEEIEIKEDKTKTNKSGGKKK